MKLSFDFLALETFERLAGVTAFIEFADKAMPEMEWQAQEALKRLAHEQGWDFGEYSAECLVLEDRFRQWLPRSSAYSAAVLLYATVEAQLFACAARVGKERGTPFLVGDLGGRGVDIPILYLERVTGVDAKQDPAWASLRDLQKIRNIIVHRGGRKGDSGAHQRQFSGLLERHKGSLASVRRPWGGDEELWISLRLCSTLALEMEAFFKRLLKSAGLPGEGVTTEP